MKTPTPNSHIRSRQEVADGISGADTLFGILAPATLGAQADIILGIQEENDAAEKMMAPIVYATHGLESSTIKTMVHRAIDEECRLLVCLGLSVARIAAAELQRIAAPLPLICVPTADPIYLDTDAAPALPSENSLSIRMAPYDMEAAIDFFHQSLPKAHKVLLPNYLAEGSALEPHMRSSKAKRLLEAAGYEVLLATGSSVTTLYNHVDELHRYADALLLLEGCMMLDVYRAMGHICEERRIPLFASSMRALKRSAALGYAGPLHEVGKAVLQTAQLILQKGMPITDLKDITVADTRHPIINSAIAPEQGLDTEQLTTQHHQAAQVMHARELV
ncbi:MAG: ABC transporter substrate binding protein [Candidatus Dependentiae bacterium]|jgi:ABC-type uncharacterized transport system substrate-binding protein